MRKELKRKDEGEVEVKNLAILKHIKHPNITELLSSYSYNGKVNLIFPLADGGTLADLLKSDRSTTIFTSDGTMLLALTGFCSALEHVHHYMEHKIDLVLNGFHHDLRQPNVLIAGTTFQLADFGLSRFKDLSEESDTTFRETMGNYYAPECQDLSKLDKLHVRRKSEIWALGCMLADVATYMVHGPQGVQEFGKKRTSPSLPGMTHQYFHCGVGKENPKVKEWLTSLKIAPSHTWKLLIMLIMKMLCIKEEDRPDAKEVTVGLRLISMLSLVEPIDILYARLLTTEYAVDARLEMWRFTAWKSAVGLMDEINEEEKIGDKTGMTNRQIFDAVVEKLGEMRAELESISSSNEASLMGFASIVQTNDDLSNLLDPERQRKMWSSFHEMALQSDDAAFLGLVQETTVEKAIDEQLRMRLALRMMTLVDVEQLQKGDNDLQLDPEHIPILGRKLGQHYIGLVKADGGSSQVLIEWRRYGKHDANEEVNRKLFERAQAVAKLMAMEKPDGFRSLNCRGFFHDQSRPAFGMVYEYPDLPVDMKCELVTLDMLLQERIGKKRELPALEKRFKLAFTLSSAIFEFHRVEWLHKDIASSNVAFFSDMGAPYTQRINRPYLIGFHHSRPDEPSAFTEGIPDSNNKDYHHPQYRKDRRHYRLEYDYYSLGLVLLEIGLWKSMQDMIEKGLDGKKLHEQLLANLPQLIPRMGTVYYEAVEICLLGKFGLPGFAENDKTSRQNLRLKFRELVLGRLERGVPVVERQY